MQLLKWTFQCVLFGLLLLAIVQYLKVRRARIQLDLWEVCMSRANGEINSADTLAKLRAGLAKAKACPRPDAKLDYSLGPQLDEMYQVLRQQEKWREGYLNMQEWQHEGEGERGK